MSALPRQARGVRSGLAGLGLLAGLVGLLVAAAGVDVVASVSLLLGFLVLATERLRPLRSVA